MSLLLSAIGFCVQLVAIASIISIIISCVFSSSTDSAFISEDHPSGAELSVSADEPNASLSSARACAKSIMSPVITTTISDDVITDDYSVLTIRQLKALCKSRGVKRYGNLRKHELVELLQH